ncbi:unnamed protein product [Euphydryas editha]|uniref:Uncharacterized protein n=1 Tax=Euphydryas editha TaxID=104508 RepID=A0AAU9UJW6_EUPED|nr:unnamed protein product [Euphydryas editha]
MAVNVCFSVKLSPNKKSIFGLRMNSQILYLVLFTGFLAAASAADTEVSCANVQSIFEKKGMLSMIDIEQQPNSEFTRSDNKGVGVEGSGRRCAIELRHTQKHLMFLRTEYCKLCDTSSA